MKNTIAAFALTVIMAASAFANGGIIVSDFNGDVRFLMICSQRPLMSNAPLSLPGGDGQHR